MAVHSVRQSATGDGHPRNPSEHEQQLQLRVAQQAAVAELGQQALAGGDLPTLFDRAVGLVAEAFDNALCQVLERRPGEDDFLLCAGVGWPEGVIGQTTIGMESQTGFTLRQGEPVIIDDFAREARFERHPLLIEQGVVSGMSVPIPGGDGTPEDAPWGVLATHSTRSRRFTPDDTHFLQAMANTLAQAIQRQRWAQSLQASEARERARADERTAERRLMTQIVEQMPAGVVAVEAPSGRQLFRNWEAARITGLPDAPARPLEREDVVMADAAYSEAYRPDQWPLSRALHHGEVTEAAEIRIVRAGEEEQRTISMSAAPIRDEQGAVVAAVTTFYDTTERLRRERTAAFLAEVSDVLASSLDYERTLEKVTHLAVPRLADWCVLDIIEDGQVRRFAAHADPAKVELAQKLARDDVLATEASRGIGRVLQTGQPESVTNITDEMMVEAARSTEHLRILRELGLRSYICMPIKGRGRVLGALTLIAAESGRRVFEDDLRLSEELTYRVALAVDNARLFTEAQRELADRERAERDLRQLNENLEERVVERTAELARRMEQLRMLAAELGEVERRERQRLSRFLHDNLQQLLVAARLRLAAIPAADDTASARAQADELLEQAIEAARSLSGELAPLVLRDLGLGPALDWLAQWAREKYDLHVAVARDTSDERESEQLRTLLFQILRELLLNIVKHADVQEARMVLERDEEALYLTVIDEGTGFVPPAGGGRQLPSGTGLTTMADRLDLLGATIDIDSQPGAGTQVRIAVPCEGAPARRPETALGRSSPDVGRMTVREPKSSAPLRILVVDDHEVLRFGLVQLIEQESDMHVVGQAGSGEGALEEASRLAPDAVVMDISLPGISGIEATRRLAEAHPDLRVIGLSIHEEENVADAMRGAGAAGYVTKGGAARELVDAIRGAASH